MPAARFAAIAATLSDEPGVALAASKGFGSAGLTWNGKLIATPRQDELLLKLPATRVAELIAGGNGRAFDAGKGKPMKEWVTALPASQVDWLDLAREALTFAKAAPARR